MIDNLPEGVIETSDDASVGRMGHLHDVYWATASSQLSPKAQEEPADHELGEAVGIYGRTLDGSTYHDNTDADEDTLSSTTRIQSRTNERNRGERADLV